ncbi:MAG: hypothetical protein F4Z38_03205 [Chloroflexi bacterium]|nr:hypothetical protein [Chloroflexota bacterium]
MQISPRRRQRALRVHELRQRGRSLRNIGKQLDISHSTVLADLKLIETRWSEFTRQSTDDFQLEQLALMQRRLRMLLRRDLLKEFGRLSPVDFVRIHEAHNQELAILLRETRRLAAQLRERADLRDLDPADIPTELDFPEEELVSALKSTRPAKSTESARAARAGEPTSTHHGLPKSSKPNHSNHPIPRKTLEIASSTAPEKISDQPPADLTPEQLDQQAETFLRNYNRQELQPTAAGG